MTPHPGAAEPEQPYDFAAAVENSSTSPSFVLIAVIDDGRHIRRTGCVLAPFLIGALQIERGVSGERAKEIAIAATDRVFRFSNARALENATSQFETIANHEACRIVRTGRSAFMADRSGEVRVGLPSSALAKSRKSP